jgi:UDP:flavonoid glycosyltransferase YjiC (YdhE family)
LLSHVASEQFAWLLFRDQVNNWRRNVLGLPPLPALNLSGAPQNSGTPILYGFSSAVCPKPADWGETTQITGYWFLPPLTEWQAPSDLVDFLADGPPPIYVGFGSMVARDPAAVTDVVLRALRRTGLRGVLIKGWGGLQPTDVGDEIFLVDHIPHEWLFHQMAAVVHHGGAGTTAAGLRAGVPSILVPFFADQLFWGRQVARLGLGPSPIPLKDLSVEALSSAIKATTNDTVMKGRVMALSHQIQREDGVSTAVETLLRFLDVA